MSINPDVDGNGSHGQAIDGAGAELTTAVAVAAPPAVPTVAPAYEAPPPPQTPPWEAQIVAAPAQAPARARRLPGWLGPAAIALIGLIAAGTLGYLLNTTTGQRDAARHQLASTQATLADSQKQLADRKATDTYVSMYALNSGRVTTEYGNVTACSTYVTCRTSAQDLLTNMKTFQSARSGVTVPSALGNADSQIGDSLTAAIAADQELITGMDTNDDTKIKEGFKKLDAAMLSFFKAETALASDLS